MGSGDRVVYCVVPEEVDDEFRTRLHEFVADHPGLELVVEQRAGERRTAPRRGGQGPPAAGERRTVRALDGRRVAERRGGLEAVPSPELPPALDPVAEVVRFFRRREPAPALVEDADTARLVARFQAGDESVYRDIYLRYFDRVYAYLRVALEDAAEAEDAAQDVFMNALQALPRYVRRDTPFRAWLFRIARNCAITRLRQRRHYTLESPAALARERERGDWVSETAALESIEDAQLVSLIGRMPQGQRQVLAFRYMLDLSYTEIAEILGRSPDGARQLHQRAVDFLRCSLLQEAEGTPGRQGGRARRQSMRRIARQSPVLGARRQRI